jgi:hypothetical protein
MFTSAGCRVRIETGLEIIVGYISVTEVDAASCALSGEYGGYDQVQSGSDEYQRKVEHEFDYIPL